MNEGDLMTQVNETQVEGREIQRVILELTRQRNEAKVRLEHLETQPGVAASYERGICYGLNFALNRLSGSNPR